MAMGQIHADVTSRTGTISLDVDADGQAEANLTSSGLKLGSGTASTNLDVSGNALVSGKIHVGGSSTPTSNLQISGTLGFVTSTITGNGTIGNASMVLADSSSGNVVVNLPDPRDSTGRMVTLKNISNSNNLFVAGGGGNIDNQSAFFTVSEMGSFTFYSNGTQWYLLQNQADSLSSPDSTLSANLILHWQLEEISGNIAYDTSSGTTYSGNLTNEHQFSGNSVTGALYKGLTLDETSDSVAHENAGTLISTEYSWAFWMKTSFDPSGTPDVAFPDPPEGKFGFSFSSGNTQWRQSAFHMLSDNTLVGANITGFDTSNWNHVAGTWDGATLKVYHNGDLENSEAATSLSLPSAGNIFFYNHGAQSDSTISFDDLRYFGRALSSEEIRILYGLGGP